MGTLRPEPEPELELGALLEESLTGWFSFGNSMLGDLCNHSLTLQAKACVTDACDSPMGYINFALAERIPSLPASGRLARNTAGSAPRTPRRRPLQSDHSIPI